MDFLKDFIGFLKTRYQVDEFIVRECIRVMKQYGLDPFRGTMSGTGIVKEYRIVES